MSDLVITVLARAALMLLEPLLMRLVQTFLTYGFRFNYDFAEAA